MKGLATSLLGVVVALLAVASIAPTLIALSGALVPLIIVLGVVVIGVKLVFFHTRKW